VWDFAIVGAAVTLGLDKKSVRQARIVLSGVAPVPWRVTEAERLLVGHELSASRIEQAAAQASTGASPLSANAYKVMLIRGAVAESLSDVAGAR
jgi:xanthine dehydrogenase YagS FAD-binding subunit